MDEDDDDFGGFEVADEDVQPDVSLAEEAAGATVSAGPDVSTIPWLAARLQASTAEPSLFPAATGDTASPAPEQGQPTTLQSKEFEVPPEKLNTFSASLEADTRAQLAIALDEKQQHKSDANELKLKLKESEQTISRLEDELANQKMALEKIQSKHSTDLEEVKSAGSKALAVVVEEYKESLKVAIIEQSKKCTDLYSQRLSEEIVNFETAMKDQREAFEMWKEEFNKKLDSNHQESLERQKNDLEEEKESWKEKMQVELNSLSEKQSQLKEELVEDVQQQLSKSMASLEVKSKQLVEEASEELLANVKSQSKLVSDQERTISMQYWEEHSSDMMKRLQENLDSTIKSQRESMEGYISERIKADQCSQKKHLSAVNVYLEAASKHIAAITDADQVT